MAWEVVYSFFAHVVLARLLPYKYTTTFVNKTSVYVV
jgi:hypothetical protein